VYFKRDVEFRKVNNNPIPGSGGYFRDLPDPNGDQLIPAGILQITAETWKIPVELWQIPEVICQIPETLD
jgi:hypothetical protein